MPVPRKRGLPGWAIALIIAGAALVLLLGAGAVLLVLTVGPRPYVSVTGCTSSNGTSTSMDYILRNKDSKPHDYTVHATVGHYPAVPDTLSNVAPGETATGHITVFGAGACQITSVDQH